MVPGAGRGGGTVAAVLVGIAEVAAKQCEGFGGIFFCAPFTACNVEETGCVDDVVSDAHD